MMRCIGIWLRRGSIQKIFFLLFLGAILGPFGIISLHLGALFGGQMRKMPDEQNQFPTIVFRTVSCKSSHAGEAHAVFNDPKEFTVGKFLRFWQTQVGRLRIEALADERVAAAIIGVAGSAMIRKVQPRVAKIFRGGGDGIPRVTGVCGNRHVARVAREHRFEVRGRSAGAQAVVENASGEGGRQSGDREQDHQYERSAFHGAEIYPPC
jgi:hypothetical protein